MRSNGGVFPFVYRTWWLGRLGLGFLASGATFLLGVMVLGLATPGPGYLAFLAAVVGSLLMAARGLGRALEIPDELRVGDQGLLIRTPRIEGFFCWDDVLEVRYGRRTVRFTVQSREQRGPVAIVRERRALVYDTAADPEHFKLKRYLAARVPAERTCGRGVPPPDPTAAGGRPARRATAAPVA